MRFKVIDINNGNTIYMSNRDELKKFFFFMFGYCPKNYMDIVKREKPYRGRFDFSIINKGDK